MMRRLCLAVCALMLLVFTAPAAHATWYEASSDHFVIYADDSKKDIRRFAENLERYHRAMEFITGRTVPPPSPSSRVVIFVVGSQRDLRRTLDIESRSIGGVYFARAGLSRAYVQDIRNKSRGFPHYSTVILLHEYAHHFLVSSSRFAMPRWMGEGAAEFFASTIFNRDGSMSIGLPAKHRQGELFYAAPVSVRELLDPELYEANRGRRYDAFYGRSWLLYHYLMLSEERQGQLDRYWQETVGDNSPIEAGETAFGDLDALEREVEGYLRTGKLQSFIIAPEHLAIGNVTLRQLPKGEAKAMTIRMASQAGVTREQALELVEDARKIAADYPGDAGVYATLAEAEYDAGNDDAAIAAADRAIALDPSCTNPYVQKGYALWRKAGVADGADADAAYAAAMEPLQALNRIENDHPIPLIFHYRSFAERGLEPPESARLALEHAAQLAPFDKDLWLNVAIMQASEGKIALARASLKPVGSDPHGGAQAQAAKALMALLGRATEGEPFDLRAEVAAAAKGETTSSAP